MFHDKLSIFFGFVKQTTIELDDSVLHIEDSFNDDDEMDPDWQKTPMARNSKRKTTVCLSINRTLNIFLVVLNTHSFVFFLI